MNRTTIAAFCLAIGVTTCMNTAHAQIEYPVSKTVDQVDDFHGTKVEDPYRWLEDDVRTSKDVAKWVADQNKVTFSYLKSLPGRDAIEKRLTKLWNYEKFGSPSKHGGRYYFSKNDGLQNQNVLYTMPTLDGEPEVLIDPNTWSKDGTVALSGLSFSDDGKYLAYGIQDGGSDWRTWRVMEIASRKLLDDKIEWVKFSGATWAPGNRGFFYGRFDEPKEGEAFQSLNLNQKVYYHRVGTSQSEDVLVYQRPDEPEWGFNLNVTEDAQYMVITVWKGTDDKYRVLYRDLTEPYAMPVDLIDTFENDYTFVGNDGPNFFFRTDLEASRGRVVAINIHEP
ncbi:MAG: S9 family peptidase, partial [Planctomycetaceae bacterium]